ncbi:MAG: ATP-binding cassette domain-containing protein, partial [Oscillospiraceae bacterium]|nr:ATP-binding cassette domain-containing protein [Oscillospiraceae bacterium]
MKQEIVRFQNVTKAYGEGDGRQLAVADVSFSIGAGEFVVILGPSGAGKSTVLNILGGMDSPDSGQVVVDGVDITHMKEKALADYRAKKVGFIFQFYNLLPSLTAYENVAMSREIVKDAADPMEMLRQVGLEACAKKFPSQMSGGE